jgi:predicted transcriptional regulator
MHLADNVPVSYTSVRIPNELWERIKRHAERLKKSATATAVECISDSLDEMETKKPGVPKIVQLSHFLKGAK